eukprot:362259-Chlamydomonas_euryale.AAC.1
MPCQKQPDASNENLQIFFSPFLLHYTHIFPPGVHYTPGKFPRVCVMPPFAAPKPLAATVEHRPKAMPNEQQALLDQCQRIVQPPHGAASQSPAT